jgi:hypothetical protein
MDIQLVSTLTSDDEEQVADVLLTAFNRLLENLPIAYLLRVTTTSGTTLQRSNLDASSTEDTRKSSIANEKLG